MRPEIRQYLEEHGREYTPEATRRALVEAGHDPAEVDAALSEWRDELGRPPTDARTRRSFEMWAAGIHAAVFVLLVLAFTVGGVMGAYGIIAVSIVLVVLFIGWLISAVIGRRLLPGSGLGVALIAPVVSALLIGGTCLAMTGGLG